MEVKVYYVGMRRFLIFFVLALIAGSLFITQKKEKDDTPLPQKLEKVMRTTRMNTYRDPFYGYVVHYPSFFEQVSNSQVKEKGYCQFRFWNVEQIVQTAFVLPNLDSLTVAQGMARFARELHATYQREGKDCFILQGRFIWKTGKWRDIVFMRSTCSARDFGSYRFSLIRKAVRRR